MNAKWTKAVKQAHIQDRKTKIKEKYGIRKMNVTKTAVSSKMTDERRLKRDALALTTETNVATPNISSPLFVTLLLVVTSWFVRFESSSARAAKRENQLAKYFVGVDAQIVNVGRFEAKMCRNQEEKSVLSWSEVEQRKNALKPFKMLHLIWLGESVAPPTFANFVWLFGLSAVANFFNVSVFCSKSDVLLTVTRILLTSFSDSCKCAVTLDGSFEIVFSKLSKFSLPVELPLFALNDELIDALPNEL